MRRLFHTSWIALLALALLAGAAVYYVGWTPGGLQRLVALANRRIGPVTLQISGVRGTLSGGLHADRVEVDHERVQVVATNVDGRVALLPLLWQTIHVVHARMDAAQVHVLPHRAQGASAWKPHFLVGLLNIQADDVSIGHATVIAPGGSSVAADQLHAVARIGVREIRIYDSTLHYGGFLVQSNGLVRAATPIGIRGTARLTMNASGQPAWLADAQFGGDLDRLQISGELLAPLSANFRGEARALSGEWHWQGVSQLRALDLRAWGAGDALGIIAGRLQVHGNRDGFGASGELEAPGLRAGALAVDFGGRYAQQQLQISRLSFLHRASGALLQASGDIGFGTGGPQLALRGQWQNLRWPLAAGSAAVHSSAGTISLDGVKPYSFEAAGELQLQQLAPMQWRAAGRIRRSGLDVAELGVTAFGGRARGRATLDWAPQQRWSTLGTMRGLNVAALRPAVSGRLSFGFAASGQGFGKAGELRAAVSALSGEVRGQSASGQLAVALQHGDWLLQQVRLQLGATRIEADGRLGAQPDLHFALDADDLRLLHPEARGRLQASGHLRGELRNPLLVARLDATGLAYHDLRLRALHAKVDFEPQGNGRADSSLRLEGFSAGERRIEQLSFSTSGTAAAHRYALQLGAAPYALSGGGTGSFVDGVWRAELARLEVGDHDTMEMSLVAPATLVAALVGSRFRLENFCLQDALATLCAALLREPQDRRIELRAANVPLQALTAGLSSNTEFAGRVSLAAQAGSAGAAPWTGTLSGTLADASLRHQLSGGRVETFSLGNGKLSATLDRAGLAASLGLDAGAAGRISGRLTARDNGAPLRDWPLGGELQLHTDALGFIESYVAQVDRVTGRLDANLAIDGTLAALGVNGELKVSGAEVDAYQINLALRDLNFDARLRDTQLQLSGSATAGTDGKARFQGELAWRDALPYGELRLSGENLRVVNIPEARVSVSPDVTMKFAGRRIDVIGTVTLPYARLQRPDELTNAVRASGDEVIVTASQPPATPEFHVFSDLTLRLGERVTIDTLGLVGRLSGSVRVLTDDSGFNRGAGELQIEEGKYTAYGRKLDVERGRLQFRNGPLNDPAIDLRAIKKFPDITAGVNVRGTLRAPRMTFFSDPPVSQSQIVSLLLAGGSLESVQNNTDRTQRSNAARDNLLLQGSALLFQQFGGKVGLDDVSVESDLNNDTSLVLGRYLSPRLYVSYGISLAEAINTIKMRYTIGDHWTIKTEAGTSRSADLVYTIER